eukprot:gene931-biopygen19711
MFRLRERYTGGTDHKGRRRLAPTPFGGRRVPTPYEGRGLDVLPPLGGVLSMFCLLPEGSRFKQRGAANKEARTLDDGIKQSSTKAGARTLCTYCCAARLIRSPPRARATTAARGATRSRTYVG